MRSHLIRDLKKQNYGGPAKVGKTLLLEKGLKYQGISMSPREMNYIQGRKFIREEIAAAFGVPMSKLTSESVNRANALAGDVQYMSDTIEPRCRRIEEKLNERLLPMYDDTGSLFVAYDDIVPADKEFRLRERSSNLERQIDGQEPVEWGDKPIMGSGMTHFGDPPLAPPGGFDLASLLGGATPAESGNGDKKKKDDEEDAVKRIVSSVISVLKESRIGGGYA
jgi:hypothetical protein